MWGGAETDRRGVESSDLLILVIIHVSRLLDDFTTMLTLATHTRYGNIISICFIHCKSHSALCAL